MINVWNKNKYGNGETNKFDLNLMKYVYFQNDVKVRWLSGFGL